MNDLTLQVDADDDFDSIIIEAINYLFVLLPLKILDGSTKVFRASKESDFLLKYWDDLKIFDIILKVLEV